MEWALLSVPKRQLIKLQAKIDALMNTGSELSPQLLSDTGQTGIKKIKVQGNPKLRPLLCQLDSKDDKEDWVFLLGAFEISSNYVPADALIEAAIRRKEVKEDGNRKILHTRFFK